MSHTHEHDSGTTADIFTKLSAVGEVCASLASGTIWVGETIDTVFSLKDAGYGLSWYGMGFGMGISLLTAAGSAYSHYILNTNNQSTAENPHQAAYSPLAQAEEYSPEQTEDQDTVSIPMPTNEEALRQPKANLTIPQMLALAGDFISDTGDKAGPITGTLKYATVKHPLPFWSKITVLAGATLFGAVASIADVRTCKNTMQQINQREAGRLSSYTTV